MIHIVRHGAPVVMLAVLGLATGCVDRETSQRVAQAFQTGAPKPDEKPQMLNGCPFHYPPGCTSQGAGHVTLYLHTIATDSAVGSTLIEDSSGSARLTPPRCEDRRSCASSAKCAVTAGLLDPVP